MGEHFSKPLLCCPPRYNHDPNVAVCDNFRYGRSYKTKRWKHIYFMSFPIEYKSIYCNEVWVWHPKDIFFYLFVEMGGKQIDLWNKLKLATRNFKQFVGEHSFCFIIEYSICFVCHCVLYTKNLA